MQWFQPARINTITPKITGIKLLLFLYPSTARYIAAPHPIDFNPVNHQASLNIESFKSAIDAAAFDPHR